MDGNRKVNIALDPSARQRSTSPLDIPEILANVFTFISPGERLHVLSFVCRQWRLVTLSMVRRKARWNASVKEGLLRDRFYHNLLQAHSLICERPRQPKPVGNEQENWTMLLDQLGVMSTTDKFKIRELMMEDHYEWLPQMLLCLGPWLTTLHIGNVASGVSCSLSDLIATCPSLLHLQVVGHKALFQNSEPTRLAWTSHGVFSHSRLSLSVRTVTFQGVAFGQHCLDSFLQRCPQLSTLRLVSIRSTHAAAKEPTVTLETDTLFDDLSREIFFEKLASWCPLLSTLHVSLEEKVQSSGEFLIRLMAKFPEIRNWGFSIENFSPILFKNLKSLYQDNRLTSLEITGCSKIDISPQDRHLFIHTIGDRLNQFLCESPNLLHLKAPHLKMPLEIILPAYQIGNLSRKDPRLGRVEQPREEITVWACRSLKTLHLMFDGRAGRSGGEEMSRVIFGYISRVCPLVEDLSVAKSMLYLDLRSGLCLLTRLSRLRRLRLWTYSKISVREDDLDWICKDRHYSPPSVIPYVNHAKSTTLKSDRLARQIIERDEALRKLWVRKRRPRGVGPSFSRAYSSFEKTTERVLHGQLRRPEKPRFVVQGIDWTHFGQLFDIFEYFQERRRQCQYSTNTTDKAEQHPPHAKIQCCQPWPLLESIEIAYPWLYLSGSDADKDLGTVLHSLRRDFEII